MERLLLAAQREEGLRQSILECVDEAHPEAFRRMLRLILDHNLARFSATVRAFDTWLGYRWDAANLNAVNAAIGKLLAYLEDPELNLSHMLEEPLPRAPLEPTFTTHWLAVHGVQPSMPQNPTPEEVAAASASRKRPRAADGAERVPGVPVDADHRAAVSPLERLRRPTPPAAGARRGSSRRPARSPRG
jgi:hypothetical protein